MRLISAERDTGLRDDTTGAIECDAGPRDLREVSAVEMDESNHGPEVPVQQAQRGSVNQGNRPFGWRADKITLDPTAAALIREGPTYVGRLSSERI